MINLEHIGVPAFSLAVGPDGVFRYTGFNELNAQLTGISAAMLIGKTPHEVFAPAVADRLCEHYRTCVLSRGLVDYGVSGDFPSGRSAWRASLMPMVGAGRAIDSIIGLCHEVTAAAPADSDLRTTNKHLDLAIRCLKGADWRFDQRSGRYDASNNLALLMGEEHPRPVAWTEWAARVLPEDVAGTSCERLLSREVSEQVVRFRFRNARDEIRWAQCRRIVAAEDMAAPVICGVIVDVTEERRREMDLEAEARRDSLTGLLNRRGFFGEMDRVLSRGERPARSLALFMLDLDDFKSINDRFGHAAGDEILVEAARRMTAALGESAVVARLGGDEFVVACVDMERIAAGGVELTLGELLGRPCHHSRGSIPMSGSVGRAWRAGAIDLDAMMADADERLYARKRSRKAARAGADSGRLDQMNLFAA